MTLSEYVARLVPQAGSRPTETSDHRGLAGYGIWPRRFR